MASSGWPHSKLCHSWGTVVCTVKARVRRARFPQAFLQPLDTLAKKRCCWLSKNSARQLMMYGYVIRLAMVASWCLDRRAVRMRSVGATAVGQRHVRDFEGHGTTGVSTVQNVKIILWGDGGT